MYSRQGNSFIPLAYSCCGSPHQIAYPNFDISLGCYAELIGSKVPRPIIARSLVTSVNITIATGKLCVCPKHRPIHRQKSGRTSTKMVENGRISIAPPPAQHMERIRSENDPLQLYSLATPIGVKVTILLEELLALGYEGAEYDAFLIKIGDSEQFGSGFVALNPNSKIPALLDRSTSPGIRVFESGAILLYLADQVWGVCSR